MFSACRRCPDHRRLDSGGVAEVPSRSPVLIQRTVFVEHDLVGKYARTESSHIYYAGLIIPEIVRGFDMTWAVEQVTAAPWIGVDELLAFRIDEGEAPATIFQLMQRPTSNTGAAAGTTS